MEQQHSLLLVDDDLSIVTALKLLLKSAGYEVVAVHSPMEALQIVERRQFSAALVDLNYQKDTTSGQEGLELIEQLKVVDEQLPIIVMTGYSSVDIAVKSMQLGAVDFIQKPWRNERLLNVIDKQIEISSLKRKGEKLSQENALLKSEKAVDELSVIAKSPAMKQVIDTLTRIAQSDMNVLLTGENGTGKSMFANYLHDRSLRASESMVSVNMGAITESLFESEMFGHVKGAFTDAKEQRIGRFELAEGGTLFLDEIANIPLSQQAKLLRVLEERSFEKVGSSKTQRVNVRLVSATNASLEQMIQEGSFRQDLLYRLNTIEISIPPLRERQEDIVPLADYFVKKYAEKYRLPPKSFDEQAVNAMKRYAWPGNIRELSHLIERALFLSQGNVITAQDLGLNSVEHTKPEFGVDFETATLEQIEKHVISNRLTRLGKQCLEIAESLGLSRSAYYRRLEKYKL
ncbi:sigma-54-dependent transcriptional regulator [Thalassotalea fusca]